VGGESMAAGGLMNGVASPGTAFCGARSIDCDAGTEPVVLPWSLSRSQSRSRSPSRGSSQGMGYVHIDVNASMHGMGLGQVNPKMGGQRNMQSGGRGTRGGGFKVEDIEDTRGIKWRSQPNAKREVVCSTSAKDAPWGTNDAARDAARAGGGSGSSITSTSTSTSASASASASHCMPGSSDRSHSGQSRSSIHVGIGPVIVRLRARLAGRPARALCMLRFEADTQPSADDGFQATRSDCP